mmetsp:Transcript_32271/g.47045  ORF Transcript_32271/g.47045 Transcript_32271/m.47045 type:complete len:186 (-) Transcript_32271:10-567(-)
MTSSSSSPYDICNKKKKVDETRSFLFLAACAILFLLFCGSSPSSSDLGATPSAPGASDPFEDSSNDSAPTNSKSKPFRFLGREKVSSSLKKDSAAEQAVLPEASGSWFGSSSTTSDDSGGISTYVVASNNYYLESFVDLADQFTERVQEVIDHTRKKLRHRIGSLFGFVKRVFVRKPKEATATTN